MASSSSEQENVNRMARLGYRGLTWLFLIAVVVQVFLAGAGIFGDFNDDLDLHRNFGFTVMHIIPILMFLLALFGRMGRLLIGLTFLLFVLVGVQSAWIEADSRWVKAVHPTMAIVMFGLAHFLAQRAKATSEAA